MGELWTNPPVGDDSTLLRRYWQRLAAAAWEGYSHLGPGAVVIDCTAGQDPTVFYLDHALAGRHGSWPVSRLYDLLVDYDPRCEIVCVVVRSDSCIGLYRVARGTLPPPQAYAQMQVRAWGQTA